MPDPWYPAAVRRPGQNADNGHTTMETVVCHYTVGRDSRPIGDRGFFHFLVSRDGTVTQFARADAACWHAGTPWNNRGPGIEVEYLPGSDDDLWTPAQEQATGSLCDWLRSEWGIPADFYDGPRIVAHAGFITHRSLIQSGDAHSDWWPYLPTGDLMAEVDLTLKALNDVRAVVGGDPNLDGTAVVLSQIVADLRRIEQKVDALSPGGGGVSWAAEWDVDDDLRRLAFAVIGGAVLVGGLVGVGLGWVVARTPMVRDWRIQG